MKDPVLIDLDREMRERGESDAKLEFDEILAGLYGWCKLPEAERVKRVDEWLERHMSPDPTN